MLNLLLYNGLSIRIVMLMLNQNPFKIVSLKHKGEFHRSWEHNVLLYDEEDIVIGYNNKTLVKEPNKKAWRTEDPALFYFHKQYYFNVIIIFAEEDYFYYCNLSSPFKWKDNELHYIDYDIDFIVQSNLTFKLVDEDEYANNKEKYAYPFSIQEEVKKAVAQLKRFIEERKGPFSKKFIQKWSQRMFTHINEL